MLDARGAIRTEVRHGTLTPRIRVTTRRAELLAELTRLAGGNWTPDNREYHRKVCGIHCKDQHLEVARQSAYWNADAARATIILYSCAPFMVAQRDIALEVLEIGLRNFPPDRGNTVRLMRDIGWRIPEYSTAAVRAGTDKRAIAVAGMI